LNKKYFRAKKNHLSAHKIDHERRVDGTSTLLQHQAPRLQHRVPSLRHRVPRLQHRGV